VLSDVELHDRTVPLGLDKTDDSVGAGPLINRRL
jgi:hypothetical protein